MANNTAQQGTPCSGLRYCRCLVPDPATHTWLDNPLQVPDPSGSGAMSANAHRSQVSPEHLRRSGMEAPTTRLFIRYIFGKKIEGREKWIAVPPRPWLPYVLQNTDGVERFVRLQNGDWAGLCRNQSQSRTILSTTRPPMRNELYRRFGYSLGISPYLPYGHAAYQDGRADGLCSPEFDRLFEPKVANGGRPEAKHTDNHNYNYRGLVERTVDDFQNEANTTVFVGSLKGPITWGELRDAFLWCGEIARVKVFPTNGFVYFLRRRDAEMAMEAMQGFPIHGSRIRLSWGKAETMARLRSSGEHRIRSPPVQTHPHNTSNWYYQGGQPPIHGQSDYTRHGGMGYPPWFISAPQPPMVAPPVGFYQQPGPWPNIVTPWAQPYHQPYPMPYSQHYSQHYSQPYHHLLRA